jgi:CBS domain-containing protein
MEAYADFIGADGAQRLTRVMRPIVWCRPDEPIRDVARRIGDAAGSFALVRVPDGLGIVTDHDFRQRVATGETGVDAPVGALATVPAITIDADASQAAGLLRMVEHGVHHLVVTDAGDQPIGVVRVVDLARAEVRDQLLVRAAVDSATNLDELARACAQLPATLVELREHGVAAAHVGAVHTAVVEGVLRRVLDLRARADLGTECSWLVLGSLARREPLPLSDVDTAVVWADPVPSAPDPAEAIRAEAGGVLADLRRCGLEPCPSGANADNPLFSRSPVAVGLGHSRAELDRRPYPRRRPAALRHDRG